MTGIASRISRFISATCMATLVLGATVTLDRAGVVSVVSDAAAQESGRKKEKTRKTPALRNNIYEKLAEAQTFAEAKTTPRRKRFSMRCSMRQVKRVS